MNDLSLFTLLFQHLYCDSLKNRWFFFLRSYSVVVLKKLYPPVQVYYEQRAILNYPEENI